ncbi:MAG: hypothetical protein A2157_06945 [Deltaproteobacteria bacterium RBG_16_47_11]|nr:MAG: hypothetical protein A2157_06945 [Deltaproteobacteria bacterium RBG_16_47_11]
MITPISKNDSTDFLYFRHISDLCNGFIIYYLIKDFWALSEISKKILTNRVKIHKDIIISKSYPPSLTCPPNKFFGGRELRGASLKESIGVTIYARRNFSR